MKKIHVALLVTAVGASALASDYKVERNFGKGEIGFINQLATGPDDTLFALENTGKITCFKEDGSIAKTIDTGMGATTAIAVEESGTIHVFSTLTELKKVKSGARMREVNVPVGVEHGVFNASGEHLSTNRLSGLKSAKAAKVMDGKLIVADLSARSLVFFDLETGKESGRIKNGLRLCCGIFDFCAAPDHTVAVSNLGAFKVQRYDLNGKLVSEFGKRGRALDDFQGCCNPVSAAFLPGGDIMTVEKDPTRIKIYDAAGKNAAQIPGVEELVKGCSFIPSAVDAKGNIYLAANTKGYIVKCAR